MNAHRKEARAPASSNPLYQRIYEQHDWYGDAQQGRCPGVRLLPRYKHWLHGSVLDLGCGRGHTVQSIRELGLECEGIDQVKIHPDMRVGDITAPLPCDYDTALCIDVIEHIPEESLPGLFRNLANAHRQIFSIHNGPSPMEGKELHITRKSFAQWRRILEPLFEISEEITIHEEQQLYLSKRLLA